jgi:hypothetical protein
MNNFIFSIADIFTKCLEEHKVSGYYIGPYQRGYKWKSKTIHDQVSVLLCDLYDAFEKSKGNTEYYLQYITVKRTPQNGSFVFEVIDGQQRLTTITLLFNVLAKYYQQSFLVKKDGKYLLEYSRYADAKINIFETIHALIDDTNTKIENIGEQDKFYMYHAFKTIHSFFELLKDKEDFDKFIFFIQNEVKIILNKEDEFTSAEEVFSSLNANKVPLTNAYLIKGLLLTKASRLSITDGQKKHFKEILDTRNLMAKTWDEMHNWFSRPEVSKYYFRDETVGMEDALKLIKHPLRNNDQSIIQQFKGKLEQSTNKFENQYEIFNQFHENIVTANDALDYLNKIKHLYKRLRNWYEDNNLYNHIGYYLCTKGKIENLLSLDNNAFSKTLNRHLEEQLKYQVKEKGKQEEKDISTLRYDNNPNNKINNILLALSVFPEGIDRSKEQPYRFDFYAYSKEGWSLEHIFPQNPNSNKIEYQDDKEWVIEQCKKENKDELVEKIKNGESVSSEDLSFIYDSFSDVHILGNMALLSSKVNSALSNGFFNTKRKILINKINSGSFVPKHTIDVFAKMLEAKNDEQDKLVRFEQNIMIWTQQDADAHLAWIKHRISEFKKEFAV